jgi:hypothetical protein
MRRTYWATRHRYVGYGSLGLFALAFGLVEASVVLYLREAAVPGSTLHGAYADPRVILVSLPSRVVALEMTREAGTLVLLAAVACLAGRSVADRLGAFFLSFGIWDLTYYAVLRAVSGWPESFRTVDVLFLIPRPWVAPVWAPATVAGLFVLGGSYLYWTADTERRYRWTDFVPAIASASLVVAAFLAGSDAVVHQRMPTHFPLWLFWSGVGLGVGWFLGVERHAVRAARTKPRPVVLRVQPMGLTHTDTVKRSDRVRWMDDVFVDNEKRWRGR